MCPDQDGLILSPKVELTETFSGIAKFRNFEAARILLMESDVVWVAPAKEPDSVEFYFVFSGELRIMDKEEEKTLLPGDCFYTRALKRDVRVSAVGRCELLYVTNGSVFELVDRYQELLERVVCPIDQKDHITFHHSKNVMYYTVKLFDALKPEGLLMDEIVAASLFHDVGKCAVPDEILKKEGKLTLEEYSRMKTHPGESGSFLLPLYGEKVAKIARAHHERLDGSGYPDGLKGDEIPYGAKLIAVADSFDAMTQRRPYNQIKTPEKALEELSSMKEQYDQKIVGTLAALYEAGELEIRTPSDEEVTSDVILNSIPRQNLSTFAD